MPRGSEGWAETMVAGATTTRLAEGWRMMSETASTAFGPLLKGHRLATGLTQEALAERAGISSRTIRELEHGTTAPHQDTVQRLATALALDGAQRAAFASVAIARPRRRPAGVAASTRPVVVPAAAARPPSPDPPHNLPVPLTSFIGRAQEISDLAHLLARTRLLTLTGAAGVGKSRLALQVAERVLHRFRQGVWLVDLGPLSDPTLVPHMVTRTLGLGESVLPSAQAALAERLRPKQLLLILGNVEHLLDACAALAEALLHTAPDVQILVTSRAPLGLAGETTWIVPPLPVPDASEDKGLEEVARCEAVQLFVERAQAAQPGFTLTAHNAAAVAQICRRLDGLPLALELAAARVRTLGVASVAAHLDQQFALLTGGSRTALPRQRTLRAALDWSHDLLTDAERVLFARLAVFAGRFTLEAVEAVCAEEGIVREDVLDLLLGVVDKSLVQIDDRSGEARYRLLSVVRAYARERLEARGEAPAVEARHAAYYLALVEHDQPDLPGRAPRAWLDRMEDELDNLRAALAWCLAAEAPPNITAAAADGQASATGQTEMGLRLAGTLFDVWFWRGQRREGLQWLERALARDSGAPTVARARALVAAGSLLWILGEHARGREYFSDAIAIYRTLGRTLDLAMALCRFGFWLRGADFWLRGRQGMEPTPEDYREGTALQDEGLALIQEVGTPAQIAWAWLLRARSADPQNARERAEAWHLAEQSLLVFQELDDPQGIGLANRTVGALALQTQDYARARAALSAAVAALRAFGDVADMALALARLGQATKAQGDIEAATRHFEESLAAYRELDFDRDSMSWVLRELGDLALEQGDPDRARARYAESLVRAQEAGKPAPIAEALDAVARLCVVEGKAERAAELRATAAAVREAADHPLSLATRAALRRAVAQARRSLARGSERA